MLERWLRGMNCTMSDAEIKELDNGIIKTNCKQIKKLDGDRYYFCDCDNEDYIQRLEMKNNLKNFIIGGLIAAVLFLIFI